MEFEIRFKRHGETWKVVGKHVENGVVVVK